MQHHNKNPRSQKSPRLRHWFCK